MSPNFVLLAVIPLLIAVGMIIAGIVLLVKGTRARQLIAPAQSWPTAPGRVTGGSIREERAEGGRVLYQPVVEYDYAVTGSEYHGSRVSLEGPYASRRQAEAVLARYAAGSTPDVYYNPNNPGEAVLARDANRPILYLALGILLLLLGLGICCVGAGLGLFLPALQTISTP